MSENDGLICSVSLTLIRLLLSGWWYGGDELCVLAADGFWDKSWKTRSPGPSRLERYMRLPRAKLPWEPCPHLEGLAWFPHFMWSRVISAVMPMDANHNISKCSTKISWAGKWIIIPGVKSIDTCILMSVDRFRCTIIFTDVQIVMIFLIIF